MRLPLLRKIAYGLLTVVFLVCSFNAISIVRDQYKATQALPRNEKLPLFNPHRPSFNCQIEATKVPPIDAQAELWFQEAKSLDDPDAWEEDRD
ncbi:MAG: sel1 repeat family protein, partial [Massilia sp.]